MAKNEKPKAAPENPQKTIIVSVSTGYVGSEATTSFEVDEDETDAAIEELAREAMFGLIEWYWEVE